MASTEAKPDRWAQFRGLSWWQLVLSFAPLALVGLGGLVGGVFGALAMVTNLKIARSRLHAAVKALAMVAVGGAAAGLYLVVAAAIVSAVD